MTPQPLGVHHDRLDARFDVRPPGVDVAAHVVARAVLVVQVVADRAAAAGAAARRSAAMPSAVEHARRGGVDVRAHRRLHAACRAPASCARACAPASAPASLRARGTLSCSARGQQRPHQLARACSAGSNSRRAVSTFAAAPCARRARAGGRGTCSSTMLAADVDQAAVLHARGTGRLAVAAGQAAVEVQLRLARSARAPSSTCLIR